jgi:glyoxylase-like metal-dependent hydrolase (beta-lactamase superfamily II)
VIVLDTQYGVPFATEAADFAGSLDKPISRTYVSHDHPDHWFGAGAFGAPVYALAATRNAIVETGEQTLASNRAAAGDFVPTNVTVPTVLVEPGEEVIDGVRFEFSAVHNTEAGAMLVVTLPEESIVLAQDLVYNNLHLFIAEGHFAGWRTAVQDLRAKGYTTVLPGHGTAGGPELYEFVLDYINTAESALASAKTGQELKEALISAHPSAGGTGLLDIQNRYLFPQS